MPKAYSVPLLSRIFRWLFRPVFRGIFHLLCQVRIQGKENVPRQGSYLVAINHVSIYEPPLVLAFWPRPLEAVGAVEIWSRRGQATLAKMYGGIQVHRGQFDRQLVEQMMSAVRGGYPLLIAPEGGRTHTVQMRRAFPGAAYIADKTELQIVPAGILGTTDDLFPRIFAGLMRRAPRPQLEMRIGKPFHLPPINGRGEEKRNQLQANADQIMIHIGSLLPPEYHGVYTQQITDLHMVVD